MKSSSTEVIRCFPVHHSSNIVEGWLRRSYSVQGLSGFDGVPDVYERAKALIRLWNQRFPYYDYGQFRAFLAEVARSQNAVNVVWDWKESTAEWIIPIDDDDWILPGIEDVLKNVPDQFVLVGWNVREAHLLHEPKMQIDVVNWKKGPHSCGYAVRRSFLETLTPRQLALLRDDHRNVHRYVDFSGRLYLFFDQMILAQYMWTPASTSSIASSQVTELSISTYDKYCRFAEECEAQGHHGVAKIARKLAELLVAEEQ